MNIRYRVTLTTDERSALEAMIQGGKVAVRKVKRAQILMAADQGSTDEAIASHVAVGSSTVYRTKQRFVEEGLERALSELPRSGAPRKLDVGEEAMLCAVACSAPPSGRARWSLQLLADEMVRLTVHETISSETIRRRLGEMDIKPWQKKMWCIPKVDGEFVARMEDVLALYADARLRGRQLGEASQRRAGAHQLDVHRRARSREAGPGLPAAGRATGPGGRVNRSPSLWPGTRSAWRARARTCRAAGRGARASDARRRAGEAWRR